MIFWTARAILVFIVSSFIFASIALLAPTWYRDGAFETFGLFAKCKEGQGCVWSHEEYFKYEKILSESVWYIVCQVLMSLGVFTVFINMILCFHWNVNGDISKVTASVNALFMLFGFLELFSTVIHYASNAYRERGVVITNNRAVYPAFHWGYLLACLATFCQFMAILLQIYHIYKQRRFAKKDAQYAASLGTGYPLIYQ